MIEEPGFRAPIKTWLPVSEIEPDALTQLRNAARHPAVGPHVAVMPDCHVGYGVTIGCVLPIVDAVLPTAVGVDIACGVCTVRTELTFDAKRAKAPYWQTWADRVRAS